MRFYAVWSMKVSLWCVHVRSSYQVEVALLHLLVYWYHYGQLLFLPIVLLLSLVCMLVRCKYVDNTDCLEVHHTKLSHVVCLTFLMTVTGMSGESELVHLPALCWGFQLFWLKELNIALRRHNVLFGYIVLISDPIIPSWYFCGITTSCGNNHILTGLP